MKRESLPLEMGRSWPRSRAKIILIRDARSSDDYVGNPAQWPGLLRCGVKQALVAPVRVHLFVVRCGRIYQGAWPPGNEASGVGLVVVRTASTTPGTAKTTATAGVRRCPQWADSDTPRSSKKETARRSVLATPRNETEAHAQSVRRDLRTGRACRHSAPAAVGVSAARPSVSAPRPVGWNDAWLDVDLRMTLGKTGRFRRCC